MNTWEQMRREQEAVIVDHFSRLHAANRRAFHLSIAGAVGGLLLAALVAGVAIAVWGWLPEIMLAFSVGGSVLVLVGAQLVPALDRRRNR